MSVERLHFGPGEMTYHAMHSADHLCRYSLLREICRGKTVLDVACGEGYGSFLLSKWGAKSVLGLDISPDAIQKARRLFPAENVRYEVGDVCNPDCFRDLANQFDIICSFETIEHVDDPNAFLDGIARVRGPQTVVAISAPNDAVFPEGGNSPFHKAAYTFDALKALTEAKLGPASQWYLGAPFEGHMLLPNEVETPPDADMRLALKGADAGTLHLLPPQHNLSVKADDALYWLGTWGPTENAVAVAAPLSMRKYLESWQNTKRLERERDLLERENRRLEGILAEERHAALLVRERLDRAGGKVSLNSETLHAIAMEVWFERQRWGLPYKIMKALKGR